MSHGITNNDQMFSVREVPWHGLGVVLDEYPTSIDEALDKAGLGWKVTHGGVLVVKAPEWTDDFGTKHPAELIPAKGFKANLREDTGDVLGIVSDEYEVVENRDAFRFLDALIGSEMHFETAGSLWGAGASGCWRVCPSSSSWAAISPRLTCMWPIARGMFHTASCEGTGWTFGLAAVVIPVLCGFCGRSGARLLGLGGGWTFCFGRDRSVGRVGWA
jgi:Domain of unknown function (DUF932)